MLELNEFMPVNYLKKAGYTGSYKGMRFCMQKAEDQEGTACLAVCAWPEPYGYDATPDEKKERLQLSFNEEGIARGVDWLNQLYEAKQDYWKQAAGATGYGKR